jgi:hypothetical protein
MAIKRDRVLIRKMCDAFYRKVSGEISLSVMLAEVEELGRQMTRGRPGDGLFDRKPNKQNKELCND